MLRLEALTKRFGETVAVAELTLELEEGEFLSLLGPSGCGKTTTLRMIAGFEKPDEGRVLLQGRDLTALPPQRRGMGMVFQSYALFPHLDVYENVAFGLRARGAPAEEIEKRVLRSLERVDLAGYERRAVQALSGGQQQRVALARAMAPEPPLLLLDEPLSNLDAALRERTRTELRALLKEFGITAVFVTHDQEEAFALSDRIAVMKSGRLQQLGTPEELYRTPANAFVASFVGSANFITATMAAGERSGEMAFCELPGGAVWQARVNPAVDVPEVRVMVRPEDLELSTADAGDVEAALRGTVLDRRFGGASTFYRVAVPADGAAADRAGIEVVVSVTGGAGARAGDAVLVRPREGALLHAFPSGAT